MQRLDSQEARRAYNDWHKGLEVDAGGDKPWHRLVKRHLNLAQDLTGRRILEIGCGRGGFACWLAGSPGPPERIVAADFSRTALEMGRGFAERLGLNAIIRWQIADIQNLPFADDCFQTVISCDTIEHVVNSARAVRELGRVLRPGGRLFLTTPNYLNCLGLYRAYLYLRGREFSECGQPINQFMFRRKTCRWVRQAGLRILATDAAGHFFPFPGRLPIEVPGLDSPRLLTKWFGLHSLTVAVKATHRDCPPRLACFWPLTSIGLFP